MDGAKTRNVFCAAALAILAIFPTMASAEIVISNSATVQSNTSASASSGGNSVESGGVVRTGDASASAQSSVQSSGGETVVDIQVETEVDGKKTSESYYEEFSGDEPIVVEAEARASAQESESSVKVNGEEVAGTTTVEFATEEAHIAAAAEADMQPGGIFERISAVFVGFFSLFRFW